MDKKIIKKVLEALNHRVKSSYAIFSDNEYKAAQIDKNNFHIIDELKTDNKVAFIDGGNAEIIGASNFSLQLIRCCYVLYKSKRLKLEKKEFYALVTAEIKGEKVVYKTETFGGFDNLIFNSEDETLKEGVNRANISKIGDVIRRFSELKMASELASRLDQKDIIVLDGDLKVSFTDEIKYFNDLYNQGKEKNVFIAAIAKTSRVFTDSGDSLIVALDEISPKNCWYYYPVVEINNKKHEADMFIVKLHERSNYIFKLEVYKGVQCQINELLSILKHNSSDPVFLGYPYGLVEADRYARVSNEEIEYLRTTITAEIGKDWSRLGKYVNTLNAHNILDNIR